MAARYATSGTVTNSGGAANWGTVSAGGTINTGELLLFCISCPSNSPPTVVTTGTTGWTAQRSSIFEGNNLVFLYKIADSQENGQTGVSLNVHETPSAGRNGGAALVRITGANNSTPFAQESYNTDTTNLVTSGTMTYGSSDGIVIAFMACDVLGTLTPTASNANVTPLTVVNLNTGGINKNVAVGTFIWNGVSSNTSTVSYNRTSGTLGMHMETFYVAPAPIGPANVKTVDGLVLASVKTVDDLVTASVKTIDGLN